MIDPEIVEILADLEHEQWMEWTQTLYKRMVDDILHDGRVSLITYENRWTPNWKPYSQLTEETKEFDRKYALKVIGDLNEHGYVIVKVDQVKQIL